MKIKSYEVKNGLLELTLEGGEKVPVGEYSRYTNDNGVAVIIHDDSGLIKVDYYDGELPGKPRPGSGVLVIDCRKKIEGEPYIA